MRMDYMVFKTRAEADKVAQELKGWGRTYLEQLHWPDSPCANRAGNVWGITVDRLRHGSRRFLRCDGSVR
jgi:hypothetical protein